LVIFVCACASASAAVQAVCCLHCVCGYSRRSHKASKVHTVNTAKGLGENQLQQQPRPNAILFIQQKDLCCLVVCLCVCKYALTHSLTLLVIYAIVVIGIH
jgi:hypothetical protein